MTDSKAKTDNTNTGKTDDKKTEEDADVDKKPEEGNTYIIRPNYTKKFRPAIVREKMHEYLTDFFSDKIYDAEETTNWSKEIADELKNKLKQMGFDRYKFITQVVIGEQRGQAAKMGCRCFWDSDTDNYAEDVFLSDTLFCVATVFGVFYY